MKQIIPTEDDEQIALIEWAMHIPILRDNLYHIANQRLCSVQYRIKLKKMGARKGVVDLNLPVPNKKYIGLWMEFKKKGQTMSSVTIEQREWLARMKRWGHFTCVAFGCDEAIPIFKTYLRDI